MLHLSSLEAPKTEWQNICTFCKPVPASKLLEVHESASTSGVAFWILRWRGCYGGADRTIRLGLVLPPLESDRKDCEVSKSCGWRSRGRSYLRPHCDVLPDGSLVRPHFQWPRSRSPICKLTANEQPAPRFSESKLPCPPQNPWPFYTPMLLIRVTITCFDCLVATTTDKAQLSIYVVRFLQFGLVWLILHETNLFLKPAEFGL